MADPVMADPVMADPVITAIGERDLAVLRALVKDKPRANWVARVDLRTDRNAGELDGSGAWREEGVGDIAG
jgi:hypothetical protein